jgi:DNA polymerase III subunit delta'
MNPNTQVKLYGLNRYFDQIIKIFELKKMPNKILFSGKKGSGKSTMSYHFINYIFSQSEKTKYNLTNRTINTDSKSYKLIKNNSHPNFYLIDLIDEKKNIEIDQIRKMIDYTNKYSFNDQPRFILIDNVENLNNSSTNALLKIIEEPQTNVFFILIHNSNKKILPTLQSRCLIFKIDLSFDETIDITNKLVNDKILDLINNDLISYYYTPGDFLNLVNFAKEKKIDLNDFSLSTFIIYLIEKKFYKKDKFVYNLILNCMQLYFLKIFNSTKHRSYVSNFYHHFINRISEIKRFNLDDESLFIEFKSKFLNE